MAKSERAMVQVRTPNKPGYVGRLDAVKYEAMKAALLKVLPRKWPGFTQAEMFDAVGAVVDRKAFPKSTHVWWAKGVQLDLEARGVLERDEGKPLRWRRVR